MKVHVRVPASSANLGPGFDSLGLALALYNEVTAEEADGVRVAVEGEGVGRLAANERNVVARGVSAAYDAAGRRFPGCALTCVNRIPLSRGLGSSAAAWVGGLVAGNVLLGSPLDRSTVLTLAARAEGHPDNVAAALLGGLTVSAGGGDGAIAVALPVPSDLHWVTLIPEITSATSSAWRCCWRRSRRGAWMCSGRRSTIAFTSPIACGSFRGSRRWPMRRARPVRSAAC